MSLYGEFLIPAENFALQTTLDALPDLVVNIERVVASEELITPYFWITNGEADEFEEVIEADPSVQNLERLDDFDRATLFRADWTQNIETIIYAYTEVGATILEASGQNDDWKLSLRFDEHADLRNFQRHCEDREIPFQLTKLHELTQPRTGSQFGLTPRQCEALVAAWEMEYFTSVDVTLDDVAADLDITTQSTSQLLQRGYQTLIEQTLVVTRN